MRQAEPKLDVSDTALFPTLRPSSQGEMASVAARPADAFSHVHVFTVFVCAPKVEKNPLSKLADPVFSVGCDKKKLCKEVSAIILRTGGKGALEDQDVGTGEDLR